MTWLENHMCKNFLWDLVRYVDDTDIGIGEKVKMWIDLNWLKSDPLVPRLVIIMNIWVHHLLKEDTVHVVG